MTQTQWVILIVSGVVLSVIVGVIRDVLTERREKPLYEAFAAALGLSYSETVAKESLPRANDFALFSRKDSERISFVMHGTVRDREVWILDYVYSTFSPRPGGNHRPPVHQTHVMFRTPDDHWPDFRLMPEGFGLGLTKLLGVKDINFDDAPEFSHRYLLKGGDEAAIRGVFRQQVTDAFARSKGWCVEAHGDTIVFWRNRERVPPKDIGTFLEQVMQLLDLLTGG